MTTYEEWRITGTCDGETVDLIWRPQDGDTEEQALSYHAWAREQDWTDGPHLHKRTVTVTDWTEVEA